MTQTHPLIPRPQTARNKAATFYMILAVLDHSLIPIAITLTNASRIPFLFTFAWRIGLTAGYLTFLVTSNPKLVTSPGTLRLIRKRMFDRRILLGMSGNLDLTLFAMSTRFIDISVATILWQIWPIIFIFLTSRLLTHQARYRRITPEMLLFLAMSFAGFALVVTAQSQTSQVPGESTTSTIRLTLGILLVAGAALASSLTAFSGSWGADLSQELQEKTRHTHNPESLDMFAVMTAHLLCNISPSAINGATGLIRGETIGPHPLALVALAGIITDALGTLAWRKSNLITNNLGINGMGYITPVLALAWLALFSQINVAHPGHFTLGAGVIVLANILINFEAQITQKFRQFLSLPQPQ